MASSRLPHLGNAMDQLEHRVNEFFINAKKNRPEWKEEQMETIKKVDRHLRKLDQELAKFKMELEADNAGITEILERRSLELDSPSQPVNNHHAHSHTSVEKRKYTTPTHHTTEHIPEKKFKSEALLSTLTSDASKENMPGCRISSLSSSSNNIYSVNSSQPLTSYNLSSLPSGAGAGAGAITMAAAQAVQATAQVEYFHSTQAGVLKKAVLLPGQHSASETEIQLYRRVFAQHGYLVEYFHSTQAGVLKKAVLLPGQHSASETEIQLYRRVFAQHGYLVSVSRFAEKSHIFKQETNEQNNVITWDILICLQSSETNCPNSEDFDKLKRHQKVNTIPWIKQAFFGNDGVCHLLDRLAEKCTLPHIRQMYTDPPLELTPQFSPKIKDYYSEVPFDVVTVKIRAEPVDCRCQVHLDDRKGPRTANYPVGLGSSRINILVVNESQPEPVVMTIYTLNIYRENRPSLPIFDEYMMVGGSRSFRKGTELQYPSSMTQTVNGMEDWSGGLEERMRLFT
ncbi:UNVERIFIED_CONTAM: hypothetical protein FKN15_058453 [Acipenser sinensis]